MGGLAADSDMLHTPTYHRVLVEHALSDCLHGLLARHVTAADNLPRGKRKVRMST